MEVQMINQETNNTAVKELSPYILIQPYKYTITIGKDIVRALGFPKYVCLRINESSNSFAIIPCEEHDVMSFKVPERLLSDHHTVFRINSKQFVLNLILKYDLDVSCVYGCRGAYGQKVNAVIVNLSKENIEVRNIINH